MRQLLLATLLLHAITAWTGVSCPLIRRDLFAVVVTGYGGLLYHRTRKITTLGDSSSENESIATLAATHAAELAIAIQRAMEQARNKPTPIVVSSDNESNLKVCLRRGAAGRVKHVLRRWASIKQRVAEGKVHLVHLPDPQMPTDFLTKWTTRAKVADSLAYLTGSDRRVPPSRG